MSTEVPRMSFMANSTAPDDKSCEACWVYLVYDRGMWVKKETSYKFPSFACNNVEVGRAS